MDMFASTTALAAAIRAGETTAQAALEAHLAQIEQHNHALNAVCVLNADAARMQAAAADAALARGELWGALHGVPFTLKDGHATAGVRTTMGFAPLDHVPTYDSTVTARLKAAGGILMGKTNVHELLGDPLQSDNPIFGRTNNPWDTQRAPGGSSGGAAAAVAAGLTPFDVGSDLAGSIRIPAHFCGVYGLKPTEHRVSQAGFFPDPHQPPRNLRIMTCIGPLARSIEDVALVHALIAGPDQRDTEVPPVPLDRAPEQALAELRVAYAPTFGGLPVAADIRSALDDLAQRLEQAGALVATPPLPAIDGERIGALIGMLIGALQPQERPATLAEYLEALDVRDQAIRAWEQIFSAWDVLLCPAALTTAIHHCAPGAPLTVDGQAVDYWLGNAHSALFNYTGHPALVLPWAHDSAGLPIGVQLVAQRWGEARLLSAAKAIAALGGGFRRPAGF